jgi:hypothetical protein
MPRKSMDDFNSVASGVMGRFLRLAGPLLAFLLLGADDALANSPAITAEHATGTLGEAYTMSGSVTLTGLGTGTDYRLLGVFEGLPTIDCPTPKTASCATRYYRGSYVARFSGCSGGTITGGIETVAPDGTVRVSGLTSADRSALSVTATSLAGVSCSYGIRFAGKAPEGTITGARTHMWVLVKGAVVSDIAGPAMQAPLDAPPPIVPEAPFALLLPVTGLLTATLVSLLALRRRRREVATRSP